VLFPLSVLAPVALLLCLTIRAWVIRAWPIAPDHPRLTYRAW